MPPTLLPVDNATQPFWHRGRDWLHDHARFDDIPETVDIAVIGAGISGVSTAYHLLQQYEEDDVKPCITVLEARGACSGATGRNGGHCKPDPFSRAANVLDSHGQEVADEVISFESRHLSEIARLVRHEGIDCDFVLTRATDVCLYEEGTKDIEDKLRRLEKAGVTGLDDIFHVSGTKAEGLSGIKHATSATTYTAGHLWPYKLVLHLLRRMVQQHDVFLFTHNPVSYVSPVKDANDRYMIDTAGGVIRATTVVFATNGYTAGLLPEIEDKIVPVRGICCRINTEKVPAPLLSNSYILRFNEHEYDYLVPRTDGSIVVGGARRDYYTDLDTWFGNHDDSQLIEPAKHYFDGYMQRHFHGWEDSEATTESVWTGIMGYTADGFPFVGEVPDKPNVYICAGFSGHGMPQAFLSAKAVAEMIAHDKTIEEVDLPRVYRSTKERFTSKEQHISLKAWERIPQENRRSKASGNA